MGRIRDQDPIGWSHRFSPGISTVIIRIRWESKVVDPCLMSLRVLVPPSRFFGGAHPDPVDLYSTRVGNVWGAETETRVKGR